MRAMRSRASLSSAFGMRSRSMATARSIDVDRHAEGLGDGVGGDVVVGRADAAGGEDVGVAGAERVDRRDDLRLDIGHDPDFAEVDADVGQVLGDVADVLVLGPPGQNLVADDEDGGGDDSRERRPAGRPWLCVSYTGRRAPQARDI